MEEQHGGPLQKGTVAKPESLDHVFFRVVQRFPRRPFRLGASPSEPIERPAVELAQLDPRQGHVVPRPVVRHWSGSTGPLRVNVGVARR